MGVSKKESNEKENNDVTETLSSEEIIRQHFKSKADKAAAEESARKKIEDDQNTPF